MQPLRNIGMRKEHQIRTEYMQHYLLPIDFRQVDKPFLNEACCVWLQVSQYHTSALFLNEQRKLCQILRGGGGIVAKLRHSFSYLNLLTKISYVPPHSQLSLSKCHLCSRLILLTEHSTVGVILSEV